MKKAKGKPEGNIPSAKVEYVEKRQAEIDKWNIDLEDMDVKIKAAEVDAKARLEHKEHINVLRQKRDEAKTRLSEIQAAGEDRWEDLKDGLENVWINIKDGFEKVRSKF